MVVELYEEEVYGEELVLISSRVAFIARRLLVGGWG